MRAAATPLSPGLWQVVAALAAFLFLQHARALTAPFFSDDYLFFDKLAGAPFAEVWRPDRLAYHWYRPWSRELHYWTFLRLFQRNALPYHLASFALWLATMGLYWELARRAAGRSVATLACCGVVALSAWGVLLEWAPGVQDLWMMAFALASLLAFASRRPAWATLAFGLALASKETAALVPALAVAWSLAIDHDRPAAAARRVAPLVALVVVWAAVHPALGGRWWWARSIAPLPAAHTVPATAATRSLLALVNLDLLPRPLGGWRHACLVAMPGAVVLALLAATALARRGDGGGAAAAARPRGIVAFSIAWMVAGFLPLLAPSVVWQPYYALFGALGAWIAIGLLLERAPRIAVAAIAALAVLAAARSDTATRDWGNESLQRFGKGFMAESEAYFEHRFPRPPHEARLWFTGVPRGVVFVVGKGDTPALRVWFSDRTVKGGFWNDYRPRGPRDAGGLDYFFRWDSTSGWVEVVRGTENADSMRALDPRWREDHERLAWVLLEAGDVEAASAEYEKLARFHPARFDYAYLAGMAHEAVGDTSGAARWYAIAARLPGGDAKAVAALRAYQVRH